LLPKPQNPDSRFYNLSDYVIMIWFDKIAW